MTMFVGAYWSQRKETREEAADRIASFLAAISKYSGALSRWFDKGWTKAAVLEASLATDSATIASKLGVTRGDFDREPVPELGYDLDLWNGEEVSFSATMGSCSPYVSNAVVLTVGEPHALERRVWRQVLEAMIQAFDPEHAVVTSHEHLDRTEASEAWEAGWFTYERGSEVQEHPFL